MGEREQAEERAVPAASAAAIFPRSLRLHRAEERVRRAAEEKQHQHLRQPGEGKIPEPLAEQQQAHAEQREPSVEEPLGGEVTHQHREEKERRARRRR